MYYVHFDGSMYIYSFFMLYHFILGNRRLDEWVSESAFQVGSIVTIKEQKKVHDNHEHPQGEEEKETHYQFSKASGPTFEARPRNIDRIIIGRWDIHTWYYSPYPKEIVGEHKYTPSIYICEFCLSAFKLKRSLDRHMVFHRPLDLFLFLFLP